MKTLVQILRAETETLRIQYLQYAEEWATKNYDVLKARKQWKEVDWCNCLGIEAQPNNRGRNTEFLGFPVGFHNTKNARKLQQLMFDVEQCVRYSLEGYVLAERNRAEQHYTHSICKLADRLIKKGLNPDNLKATTSHIDTNISTTLTDGVKTVRAYTIIASGDVQRPHYRYLIK